jgi:hypothetical protein
VTLIIVATHRKPDYGLKLCSDNKGEVGNETVEIVEFAVIISCYGREYVLSLPA